MWHTKRWQQNHYSSFRHRNVTPRWRKKGGNRVETQLDWTMSNFSSAKDKSLLPMNKCTNTFKQPFSCKDVISPCLSFRGFDTLLLVRLSPQLATHPDQKYLASVNPSTNRKGPLWVLLADKFSSFSPFALLTHLKTTRFLSSDLFTLEIDL